MNAKDPNWALCRFGNHIQMGRLMHCRRLCDFRGDGRRRNGQATCGFSTLLQQPIVETIDNRHQRGLISLFFQPLTTIARPSASARSETRATFSLSPRTCWARRPW